MNPATLVRKIDIAQARAEQSREILRREWLLTNGLGGYASGTISGTISRRYHGLLVAALPAPYGRVVMLNHLAEVLHLPNGRRLIIGGQDARADEETPDTQPRIREFRLEDGLPIWIYEAEGVLVEKRLLLVHGQNTLHVSYQLLSAHERVTLEFRPSIQFRPHEHDVSDPLRGNYSLRVEDGRYELSLSDFPHALRFYVHHDRVSFTYQCGRPRDFRYEMEEDRGYGSRGALWSPGAFTIELQPQHRITLVASSENWSSILAVHPDEAFATDNARRARLLAAAAPELREAPAAELVLAADQFIINPAGRLEDAARARAGGDEVRTVIAGYHWFTDWGRDTMISLEGLTLITGRHQEAGWILRTFAHYIRDGLIPNMFPEGQREGLYHTADATLWFVHAVDRYLAFTQDRATLRLLLPKLVEIIEHHIRGTRFGIGVDSSDGLLRQGEQGYQLTWMDAKVDGWVVTPRRGKAVEINALWYNALRLVESWMREEHGEEAARPFDEQARRVAESFNRRFWSEERGYLLDVVDGEQGDDPACRPNQIFSISLRHPVLEQTRWTALLEKVRTDLLTPDGLRSLAPDHPDYKPRYFGDLRARDAAYHQGTVWAWLIGPFIDAWLKVHPGDFAGARECLSGLIEHLDHACVGSISEIFDAQSPYTPRGCIAQAWSVAEVLRCWAKTSRQDATARE
jgi:predicted glycogen debranching enzyme